MRVLINILIMATTAATVSALDLSDGWIALVIVVAFAIIVFVAGIIASALDDLRKENRSLKLRLGLRTAMRSVLDEIDGLPE